VISMVRSLAIASSGSHLPSIGFFAAAPPPGPNPPQANTSTSRGSNSRTDVAFLTVSIALDRKVGPSILYSRGKGRQSGKRGRFRLSMRAGFCSCPPQARGYRAALTDGDGCRHFRREGSRMAPLDHVLALAVLIAPADCEDTFRAPEHARVWRTVQQ